MLHSAKMVSQNRSFKSIIIIVPEEWPAKHKNKTNINVHKLPDKFLKKTKKTPMILRRLVVTYAS